LVNGVVRPVVNYNPAGSRKASLGVELLEQDNYAVLYAGQTAPELSKSEPALRRSPIRILPNPSEDKLPLVRHALAAKTASNFFFFFF
jgi:hypothetical protein